MPVQGRVQTEYSLIEHLLENDLKDIKNYIYDQSILLKGHEQKISDQIDQEIWVEKTEPIPSMGIELRVYSSFFTYNIFYKSTLIALYSFLEGILKEVAKVEGKKRKLKIKLGELKTIVKNSERLNSLWNQVDNVSVIRNHLVHDYLGYSENRKSKEIKKICDSDPHLEYDKVSKEVTIKGQEYLLNFCSLIELLIKTLLKELRISQDRS